jgi:hypothetical protein
VNHSHSSFYQIRENDKRKGCKNLGINKSDKQLCFANEAEKQ